MSLLLRLAPSIILHFASNYFIRNAVVTALPLSPYFIRIECVTPLGCISEILIYSLTEETGRIHKMNTSLYLLPTTGWNGFLVSQPRCSLTVQILGL